MRIAIMLLLASTAATAAPVLESHRTDIEVAQSWSCQPKKTCKQIQSCDEARYYLQNCSWGGKLDRDSDGIPCEAIC
ncbi:hypothetical protein ASD54_04660 [Rhizobium sp. Root149]|nr:hypothetical protein ASD54_04660 [Rhizobium sp. Root149]